MQAMTQQLQERNSGLTGFGALVYELMARRGMSKQVELLFLLRQHGHDTKPQNLSVWLRGTQPPLWFVQTLEEGLRLNEEEANKLRYSFVHQSKRGA